MPEVVYSYIPDVRRDMIQQWDETSSSWIWRDPIPDYLPRLSSMLDPFTALDSDDVDALREENAVGWALTNAITTRHRSEAGDLTYNEMLRFKLFQTFDINEAKRNTTWFRAKGAFFPISGSSLTFRRNRYVSFAARKQI